MSRQMRTPTKPRYDQATELSLEEVIEQFDGQWVLLHITRLDEDRLPTHGRVVMHDRSHEKVCAQRDELAARPGPIEPYYVFRAQPIIGTGAEAFLALEHLAEFAAEYVEPRCWGNSSHHSGFASVQHPIDSASTGSSASTSSLYSKRSTSTYPA